MGALDITKITMADVVAVMEVNVPLRQALMIQALARQNEELEAEIAALKEPSDDAEGKAS